LTALRDSAAKLAEFEADVFMVSLDDADENEAFAESVEADLVLLSDPTRATAKRYGVTSLGGAYARRWTFYIDSAGVVRYIDKDVRVESAGQDIADRLEALSFPRRSAESKSD
jgi:peroxiredoxin